MYKHFFKRLIDISLSVIGLLVTFPILLVIWLLLIIENQGAGAFFVQTRPGKGGRLFSVIKFNTMNAKRDCAGILLPDNERITGVGRIVRALSVDELPQLINVIKGDMSLIGPRPLLTSYLPLYSVEQSRRHEIRPGITGWAQVNGRNAISWEEKFKFDVWYVDNLTLWLDVKIILITLKKVFVREGINAHESVTMEPFKGNKKNK